MTQPPSHQPSRPATHQGNKHVGRQTGNARERRRGLARSQNAIAGLGVQSADRYTTRPSDAYPRMQC